MPSPSSDRPSFTDEEALAFHAGGKPDSICCGGLGAGRPGQLAGGVGRNIHQPNPAIRDKNKMRWRPTAAMADARIAPPQFSSIGALRRGCIQG